MQESRCSLSVSHDQNLKHACRKILRLHSGTATPPNGSSVAVFCSAAYCHSPDPMPQDSISHRCCIGNMLRDGWLLQQPVCWLILPVVFQIWQLHYAIQSQFSCVVIQPIFLYDLALCMNKVSYFSDLKANISRSWTSRLKGNHTSRYLPRCVEYVDMPCHRNAAPGYVSNLVPCPRSYSVCNRYTSM